MGLRTKVAILIPEMDRLVKAVHAALPAAARTRAPAGAPTPSSGRAVEERAVADERLSRLAALLEQSDIASVAFFESTRDLVVGRLGDETPTLERQIRGFDFGEALKTLRRAGSRRAD